MRRQTPQGTFPAVDDPSKKGQQRTRFCQPAYTTYKNLDPERQARFVYLDVKSLPRTGLHFMRNSFENLLQKQFSFCEWYYEPGCCRQMPCAVTGYATEMQDAPLLRMIKSHDLNLTDPVFLAEGPIQRLILLRDPLYLLTSWWALRVLYLQRDLLKQHGIKQGSINFAHDIHVMRAAYRIIDEEGISHTSVQLQAWLKQVSPYLLGFARKWAQAMQANPRNCRLVRYKATPQAVLEILEQMRPWLPTDTLQRIEAFRINNSNIFQTRSDPFITQSKRISDFLQNEADIFRAVASALNQQDRTGFLAAGPEN